MDHSRCIASVWPGRGYIEAQCGRKRGHGKDGLYCKQHGARLEHRDDNPIAQYALAHADT